MPLATAELAIDGMTCGSCVAHVEAAVRAIPGVTTVGVNLATERATVNHHDGLVSVEQLIEACRAGGEPVHISCVQLRTTMQAGWRAAGGSFCGRESECATL